jgi:hypothetical protein
MFKQRHRKGAGSLSKLLWDAAKYPLTLVIAARLHLENHSVEDFRNVCKFPMLRETPKATRDEVEGYMREIKGGNRLLDNRLRELAMNLNWP